MSVVDEPALAQSRLDVLRRIGPTDGWGVLPAVATALLELSGTQLRQLRAAGEAGSLRDCAHRLRGAAVNVGAERLAASCAEVERLAKTANPVPTELLDRIDAELSAAGAELTSILAARA